jgi:hypothetical protein
VCAWTELRCVLAFVAIRRLNSSSWLLAPFRADLVLFCTRCCAAVQHIEDTIKLQNTKMDAYTGMRLNNDQYQVGYVRRFGIFRGCILSGPAFAHHQRDWVCIAKRSLC